LLSLFDRLPSAADFFSDYPAQRRLQGFSGTPHVIPERFIDQALIVTAAGSLNVIAEPFRSHRRRGES
jgi:hypothetical protein